MGHIHKYQVLSGGRPPNVYPGSLERIDFGEQNDKKGFVSVEIGTPDSSGVRPVHHEFHEVPARRFLTIKVDAASDFPTETVLQRIEENEDSIRDAVVRLVIETTPEHLRDLRQDEIRRVLNSKEPSFGSVVTNSARAHRMRLGDHVVEQMNPRQALQIYLEDKNTPPDRVAILLRYYDKLNASLSETHAGVGD
jgi:exonuclease SbcD